MGTNQTWNSTYENEPVDLSNPANGNNAIQNLKTSTRNRLAKEHRFSTASGDLSRQGIHQAGSAMPFIQDTAPQYRTDGTQFEVGYDEGRLWIDTGGSGRMMFLDSILDDTDSYSPTWKPVLFESVGKVQSFVSNPPSEDRWTPCDGRLISKSDTSEDGTDGGYSDLVDFLLAEASGNSSHPYYSGSSTSAYLPDLRGVSLRGLDSFDGVGSTRGAVDRDHDGVRFSGGYQEDAVVDHDHKMDHTHGSDMLSDGHDSGEGRTGTGSYSGNTVSLDDDGDHTHEYQHYDGNNKPKGAFANEAARDNLADYTTFGDASHHHAILRYYGLTRLAGDQSAENDPDIPDRSDQWNTSSENVDKNVAIYWMIKY